MRLLFVVTFLSSVSVLAKISHCGHLTNLAFVSGEAPIIRMGVMGPKDPNYVTVTDKDSITKMIRQVSGNEDYAHRSSDDNFEWRSSDSADRFFVCVQAPFFDRSTGGHSIHQVERMQVWKNRIQVAPQRPKAPGRRVSYR